MDHLPSGRDKTLIETLYVTASRVNELCTKSCTSDKKTKALGRLVTSSIEHFKWKNLDYPILKVKIPVEKRKAKSQVFKNIVLPMRTKDQEPWVEDVAKWIYDRDIREHSEAHCLCFDLTRNSVYKIVRKNLLPLDKDIHPHSIRHYRLTHLFQNYGFDGKDLAAVAGWTLRSGFNLMGEDVSPMVNIYIESQWQKLMPKLLRPLSEVYEEADAHETVPINEQVQKLLGQRAEMP